MVSLSEAKVLVVGAGGIGCELLKNLVLSGFRDIKIIDLDTIDFSNLNRQFLFRKEHVGKSKALVARDSVLEFCPDVKIIALHDTIIKDEYNREFFAGFDIVLNALDNRLARNHVNRLCLAANVPLVESGTQGYLGQVQPILKGVSECYECRPKAAEKTFAGCTIRNTPSEPIHCIVWAKHLFNQLFGLQDADEEVSPDSTDPELGGKVDANDLAVNTKDNGNVSRVSTRQWAADCKYEAEKVFNKLFNDDIVYLRNMGDLWKKRKAPEAIKYPTENVKNWVDPKGMRDQRIWTTTECAVAFRDSITILRDKLADLPEGDYLSWDKDDDESLDFVTACANIRMECFGIKTKSQFEVKSMAGNIIPAIATTNAVISGLLVLQAIKILKGKSQDCRAVYLSRQAHPDSHQIVRVSHMEKPNPKCYSCSEKHEIFVIANTKTSTMKSFRDKFLKDTLNMTAPDVTIEGTGNIVISSEEGETDALEEKTMAELGMIHCARLCCDDFLQNFNTLINIVHSEEALADGAEFEARGELPKPKEEKEVETPKEIAECSSSSSNHCNVIMDDDEDLVVIEPEEEEQEATEIQEDNDDDASNEPPQKKLRISDTVIPIDIR